MQKQVPYQLNRKERNGLSSMMVPLLHEIHALFGSMGLEFSLSLLVTFYALETDVV